VPSKSRQRQLQRLAARRLAERRRRRRNRIVATAVTLFLILGGGGAVAAVLLSGGGKPSASPSATPPSPSTTTPPAGAVACGGTKPAAAATVSSFNGKYNKAPSMTIDTKKNYLWTLDTSCGQIQIELTPDTAPNTVNSLVFLTKQGLYNGNSFHRLVPGFVIQGGDPAGTGSGGPGYTTVDPPPKNATYTTGTIAMAKTQSDPNGTAGSQFFVVLSDSAQQALAGQYAIVGHVLKGMDVVTKIAAIPIRGGGSDGPPTQTIYIDKATVTVEK
jgi:cyclophilin family peptidyl-prolyl cis-trans isomerase